jgi:hypothetical protein
MFMMVVKVTINISFILFCFRLKVKVMFFDGVKITMEYKFYVFKHYAAFLLGRFDISGLSNILYLKMIFNVA